MLKQWLATKPMQDLEAEKRNLTQFLATKDGSFGFVGDRPAGPEVDRDHVPCTRQIGDRAFIATVHPRRAPVAQWALGSATDSDRD